MKYVVWALILFAGYSGWKLASVHEGMARAAAVNGDATGRAAHIEAAEAALAEEPSTEDAQMIADQLATVP